MFRVNPSEAQLERITVHGDTIGLIPDGSISPLNLPRDAVTQQVIRYVNYQYLALLCELMTQCGFLMAITRHGIRGGCCILSSRIERT